MLSRRKLKRYTVHLRSLLREKGSYHQPDYVIIGIVAAVVVFGLVMLSSASSVVAYARYESTFAYFNRQLFGVALGAAAFFVTSRLDYRRYKDLALPLLLASLGLLILVFIPGLAADWGTSRSWINIFGFSLQPAEFVKITFLLYLGAWISKQKKDISDLHHGTAPFLILLAFITALLLAQPDTGTWVILMAVSLAMYFVGGGNIKHIAVLGAAGALLVVTVAQFAPYQLDRFRCFFDSSYSPNNICYQVNQSLIAVGSGGLWGRGFGNSRQKFRYLPEVQGDAIFPIIAEETGFLFSLALVGLFVALFWRGLRVAYTAPDLYGRLVAIGIVTWFSFQAFVNIGGMINVMPMTGLTLPFISYGGSAMMASLAAAGILVNVSKQTK